MFDQPANLFVAGFISSPQMNFFDGELEKKDGKYQLKVGEATVVLGGKAQELLDREGRGRAQGDCGHPSRAHRLCRCPWQRYRVQQGGRVRDDGQRGVPARQRRGRDVVLASPPPTCPPSTGPASPYGTEINFAFRPDLIHLFDPETEKNLMY